MMKFTVLVIALLAPGLHSAVVSTDQITNYPAIYIPETRPLPLPVYPEVIPELPAVVPELRPEVIPEVTPELRPLPEIESPCEACFNYMSSLIDQLTDTVESSPQLPEYVPEYPEVETLPQPAEPATPEVLPQPSPSLPGVEIRPLPIILPALTNF